VHRVQRVGWGSPEVDQVGSDALSMRTFLGWMRQHRLGRKRILDTLLASPFLEVGVSLILTTNSRDFSVLGDFTWVTP
jgi:hypothetical protein